MLNTLINYGKQNKRELLQKRGNCPGNRNRNERTRINPRNRTDGHKTGRKFRIVFSRPVQTPKSRRKPN